MSRRLTLAASLCLVAAVLLSAQLTVVFVSGKASFRTGLSAQWKTLETGQSIGALGFVRTGPGSSVELTRRDAYRLLVSSNSLLRLEAAMPSSRASSSPDHVTILTGKILSEVMPAGKGFQVRTQESLMGVRGTQFAVIAGSGGEALLAVKDGQVLSIDKDIPGSEPEPFIVPMGSKRQSGFGGTPQPPVRLDAGDEAYFDFAALDAMTAGKSPDTLYDHWKAGQDRLFADFTAADLEDRRLFELEEIDSLWRFLIKENAAWREAIDSFTRGK
jgi:ferric-dicitrate binding protein FerR (iron transport regulator)